MSLAERILQQDSRLIWVGQCLKAKENSVAVTKAMLMRSYCKNVDVLAKSYRTWMWWQPVANGQTQRSRTLVCTREVEEASASTVVLRPCCPGNQLIPFWSNSCNNFLLIVKNKTVVIFGSKSAEFQFA